MNNNKSMLTKHIGVELTTFDESTGTVEGYASIFGNIDQVGDVVMPGAFQKTIAQSGAKVRFLWQHNRYEVIGKIVELREDGKGLFFKAVFAPTARGQEARELLKMAALGGFSIGYHVLQEQRDEQPDGRVINRLKELRLLEISAVTFPCNEDATATGVKEAVQSAIEALSDDEAQLVGKFMSFLAEQREKGIEEEPAAEDAAGEEIDPEMPAEAQDEPVEALDDAEGMKALIGTLELARLANTLAGARHK